MYAFNVNFEQANNGFCDTDADKQLGINMQKLSKQLYAMIDSTEQQPQTQKLAASGIRAVFAELKRELADVSLVADAPKFEFHAYGCVEHDPLMKAMKNGARNGDAAGKKKAWSDAGGGDMQSASRQNQKNSQKENLLNISKNEQITSEELKLIGLHGDGIEHNPVLRLMGLFYSLHECISADLPSSQLNGLPSDYVYDWPKKRSMPKSMNVCHQVQVLCTRAERCLAKQRRILEENKHFDFVKYNECDRLLQGATGFLQPLKQFCDVEVRHRAGQFESEAAIANAQQLETILLGLRQWLSSAVINVHVFNWEMDQEHRYSLAMTLRREAINQTAFQLVVPKQPVPYSAEEQLLAHYYQLDNVLKCAREHEDFLTAVLRMPQNYFPPEVVAICEPNQFSATQLHTESQLPAPDGDATDNSQNGMWLIEDIIEPPSSPPKVNERSHSPWASWG